MKRVALKLKKEKNFTQRRKDTKEKRIQAKDKFGEFHQDQEKDFLHLPLLFFAPLREILYLLKIHRGGEKNTKATA